MLILKSDDAVINDKFDYLSKLPLMSELSIFSGSLLTIDIKELVRSDPDCGNLFTDVLLTGIISIEER